MTHFLHINPLSISVAEAPTLAFLNARHRIELKPKFHALFCAKLSIARNLDPENDSNGGPQFLRVDSAAPKSMINENSGKLASKNGNFYNKLDFKDKGGSNFELENYGTRSDAANFPRGSQIQKGIGSRIETPAEGFSLGDDSSSGSEDAVELNSALDRDKRSSKSENSSREEDFVRFQSDVDGVDLKNDDQLQRFSGKVGIRRRKEVIRRSNLLAKQVISIKSALSLGFVSQLWVDITSWVVLFVEVRPNLLSGESERFLLEDISQVGDVVLVQDESVIENEFKMVGLETLVGYKVMTPSQRSIGKVRGYAFNINSGAVEALELDSFGISIIPSSLVSTYCLLVEDVLEVASDAVVVHEAAVSRLPRLSKGFWDSQNMGTSVDDVEEYSDYERSEASFISGRSKGFGRKKLNRRDWDSEENWELPMDFL